MADFQGSNLEGGPSYPRLSTEPQGSRVYEVYGCKIKVEHTKCRAIVQPQGREELRQCQNKPTSKGNNILCSTPHNLKFGIVREPTIFE